MLRLLKQIQDFPLLVLTFLLFVVHFLIGKMKFKLFLGDTSNGEEKKSHALQIACLQQQVQKMRERGDRYKALSKTNARSSAPNLPVSSPAKATELESLSSYISSGTVSSSRAAGSEVSTCTGSRHGYSGMKTAR